MDTLDPQKLLAVLRAQQRAIDALNEAVTTRGDCGCCSDSPAREQVAAAEKALAALEPADPG